MIQEVSARELQQRLAENQPTLLLDVRLPWEHELARLQGSQLIPLQELARRVSEVRPQSGALVVCYCHHGMRSLTGARLLEQAGIGPVASLAGGIDAWSAQIDPAVPRY